MATNLAPPPAGYTLDASALPPPPAGYQLDGRTAGNAKTPSSWDRAVSAFGEFTNPLGEPTPGEGAETRLKKIGESILDLPRQSGEALHAFGRALSTGDLAGAAYHLAGAVPLLGPMSQTVSNDLADGNIPEAVGHLAGMITTGRLTLGKPLPGEAAATDAAVTVGRWAKEGAQEAAPIVKDAIVGGVRGGLELKARRYIPVPASIAGGAAGGFAAHEIGLPHELGVVVGAAAPVVKGAIAEVKAGLARRAPAVPIEDTALLDQISRGLGGGKFADLPAEGQATVRAIAERANQPRPTPPAPASQPQPIPRTLAEIVQNPLGTFRATDSPAPIAGTADPVPFAGRPNLPAAGSPIQTPPAPPRTIAEMSAELNQALGPRPEAPPKPPAADFAAARRSPIADKLAKTLADAGVTDAQLAELEAPGMDPAGRRNFYRNLGEAHRQGYTPSDDTIALIRERLQGLEAKAQASPAPAASEPSPSVGQSEEIPSNPAPNAGQPEPAAPAGGPWIDRALDARIMAKKGYTADYAAKLGPEVFQNLGLSDVRTPDDVALIVDAMRRNEAGAPPSRGPEPPPAAAPAAADPIASTADFLRKNGYDAAKARKLSPPQWNDLGITSPADGARVIAQLVQQPGTFDAPSSASARFRQAGPGRLHLPADR